MKKVKNGYFYIGELVAVDTSDSAYYKVYDNIFDAARDVDGNVNTITYCCHGYWRRTHRDKHWFGLDADGNIMIPTKRYGRQVPQIGRRDQEYIVLGFDEVENITQLLIDIWPEV